MPLLQASGTALGGVRQNLFSCFRVEQLDLGHLPVAIEVNVAMRLYTQAIQ